MLTPVPPKCSTKSAWEAPEAAGAGGAAAGAEPAATAADSAAIVDRYGEPARQLRHALTLAEGSVGGVHVSYEGQDLLPANLKFERVSTPAFRNWNGQALSGGAPAPVELGELSGEQLRRALEAAARQVAMVRVYPGMRSDTLIAMMNTGVHYFVLELYDTGTASVRETPYSLRRALEFGREHEAYFFCTSQQEGVVDFSQYVTSHALWKEGAVPMGPLTTESAYTRLIASLVSSESEAEAMQQMEEGS